MAGKTLSFKDVAAFLLQSREAAERSDPLARPSLELVEEFVEQNRDLVVNLAQWDGPCEMQKPEIVQSITVRGTQVSGITESDCRCAFALAKTFQLNYKDTLRVIVRESSRGQKGGNIDESTLVSGLIAVLEERDATMDVAFHSIDRSDLSESQGKAVLGRRKEMIQHLFQNLKQLVANFTKLNEMDATTASAIVTDLSGNDGTMLKLIELKNWKDVIHITKILKLLANVLLNLPLQTDFVVDWFNEVPNFTHFWENTLLVSVPDLPFSIVAQLEALITLNSLLVLGFDSTISAINTDTPYFQDIKTFIKIQSIIETQLTHDPVLLYMWSFALFTKAVLIDEGSDETFMNEYLIANNNNSPSTVSTVFASKAEKLNVFQTISDLTESLSSDVLYPTIMSSFVTFMLNFVPLTTEVTQMIKIVMKKVPTEFIEKFLTTDIFERRLAVLKAKLPLINEALLPLINISSINFEFANFEWKELNTYASTTKLGELDYDLADLDRGDNAALVSQNDLIVLKQETLINPPLENDSTVKMPIPSNTKGKILDTGLDDSLVIFLLDYNGWSVLGRVLHNLCEAYFEKGKDLDSRSINLMISIIELIGSVVGPCLPNEKKGSEILQYLANNLNGGDIVSVMFKIYEIALNKRDYRVTCACAEFTNNLVVNFPHFVWSYLTRSSLFDRYGKTGLSSIFLGTLELPNGEYGFTIHLSELAIRLVEDALTLQKSVSTRIQKDILQKLAQQLINIFESCQSWKFNDLNQRFKLCYNLTSFFSKALYNVFGIDPDNKPEKKVTKVLGDISDMIIKTFLRSHSADSYSATSLLNILTSQTENHMATLGNKAYGLMYTKLIKSSFELTNLLIAMRDLLNLQPSIFEKAIFSNAATFAEFYIGSPALKRKIINLFGYLISATWNGDTPFLLSYLGEMNSKKLLNSINEDLQKPLKNFHLLRDIYTFVGILMKSKQDGLAILFLTGNIASRKTLESTDVGAKKSTTKDDGATDSSILNTLKGNAQNMVSLPEFVSCALLEAIAFSFNSWVHSKSLNLVKDTNFISVLMKKVNSFKPQPLYKTDDMTKKKMITHYSKEYRLISRIVEVFALYLYSSPDSNSEIYRFLNQRNLFEIVNPYFEIDMDHPAVQEAVNRDFANTFEGYTLSQFKLSVLNRSSSIFQHGVFNIPLMDRMFGNNPRWTLDNSGGSIRSRIIDLSLNLKYIHYQISAAKSWGALLTCFVKASKAPLNDEFMDIVQHFLQYSIGDDDTSKKRYAQMYQERIELSFYILYAFKNSGKTFPDKKLLDVLSLLITTFENEGSLQADVRNILPSEMQRSEYRPILRSVLIILNLTKSDQTFVELAGPQLLKFLQCSFSQGVYVIFSSILADITASTNTGLQGCVIYNLEDKIQNLFLLLALLNKIKDMNPSEKFKTMFAISLDSIGTIKVILSLYSSSHLFRINDEPIIGHITLTFISQLCTISTIAENFIKNGLFAVLLESPLSVALQNGSIKPENHPRLHNIWSNGLLSILLLLLSGFGAKILPEACLFASYFGKQIKTATYSWSDPDLAVSSALIRETSQLILLQKMLAALHYQRYLNTTTRPKVTSSSSSEEVTELICGLDTGEERRELNVALKKLLTHPKYLNSRIVGVTVEELQLLDHEPSRTEFVKNINREIKELQEGLLENI